MGNNVNVRMSRRIEGSWEEVLFIHEDYIDTTKWAYDFERFFSFEVEGKTDGGGIMELIKLEVGLKSGASSGKVYFRGWGYAVEV